MPENDCALSRRLLQYSQLKGCYYKSLFIQNMETGNRILSRSEMEIAMKKKMFWGSVLFFTVLMILMTVSAMGEPAEACTDVVVLSTTDMHGKCWNTNVLTGGAVKNNMLRVSTAVKEIREEYGAENVLLVDNGDLFQGTPVSQVQLMDYASGQSREPLAMALCVKEIGYDAFVPGNHEYNYDWETMRAAYRYLEENGVPVLEANGVYDGSDGVHEAGENAFTPYVIKTVTVGGHAHRIGILGFGSTDITKWDLPVNYPGLRFSHPGNENYSLSREAGLYIPQMKAEGCEFIIVSFHGGLGDADRELVFGENSTNQGLRLLRETEDIDLLITGHDHTSSYSNQYYKNHAGRWVLVVNGGGQELTKSVIRFSEDESGALTWKILESENLDPGRYDTDQALETKIAPYAERAAAEVEMPLGTAAGDWDGSNEYHLRQTDTVDLVSAAAMDISSKRLRALYGDEGPAALGISGLDHLDVDMSITSATASDGYAVQPGDLSVRDLYRLYRYDNNLLVLPLTGREIRSIMEENASTHFTVRVLNGRAFIYTSGSDYTNLLFGGLNFVCDLSKPSGSRVQIEGFSNGRAFDDDAVYLVTVNNYILGNKGCRLRDYSMDDAVWSQIGEGSGETIQDILAEYVREQCAGGDALTPDVFGWHWSIGFYTDPAAIPPYEGETGASLVDLPKDGHTYILYQEPEGMSFTAKAVNGGLGAAACAAYGNVLAAPLPEDALLFTVHFDDEDRLRLTDPQGRYLTCTAGGGLKLTDEMAKDDLSLWTLQEANGGWFLVSAGADSSAYGRQAVEFYGGRFTTYRFSEKGSFILNFYE